MCLPGAFYLYMLTRGRILCKHHAASMFYLCMLVQSYPICRLKLVVETFEKLKPTNRISVKVSKVVKPTNKKTLGTSLVDSPLSPLSFSLISMYKFSVHCHITYLNHIQHKETLGEETQVKK